MIDIYVTTAVLKDTPIPQRLEMPSFTPPKHLDPIIYPTGVGVSSVSGREVEQQMLSTAIQVTLDPQKSVKVSPPLTPIFGRLYLVLLQQFVSCSLGVPGCPSTARCHDATLHDTDESQLARAGERAFTFFLTEIGTRVRNSVEKPPAAVI